MSTLFVKVVSELGSQVGIFSHVFIMIWNPIPMLIICVILKIIKNILKSSFLLICRTMTMTMTQFQHGVGNLRPMTLPGMFSDFTLLNNYKYNKHSWPLGLSQLFGQPFLINWSIKCKKASNAGPWWNSKQSCH